MMTKIDILLVEDDPHAEKFALRALTSLSAAVYVARDGAEALDFIFCQGYYSNRTSAGNPRLVLLDLNLPKVSGLDVLKRIKSEPKYQTIPVVVLTSSHLDKEVVQSYRLGANSFIVKEADFDKFTESVSQVGRYWLRQNYTPEIEASDVAITHN